MAEIICTSHGMQSISFTSMDISKIVTKKKKLNDLVIVRLVLHLPFEKKGTFWIDRDFLTTVVGIPFENALKTYEVTDEERAFDIYTELHAVCSKCLKEVIARKLG